MPSRRGRRRRPGPPRPGCPGTQSHLETGSLGLIHMHVYIVLVVVIDICRAGVGPASTRMPRHSVTPRDRGFTLNTYACIYSSSCSYRYMYLDQDTQALSHT